MGLSTPEQYDLLVLGSGAGGKLLAWTLGAQGKRCAVVERQWYGGSCPNVACLPSKNLIYSAKVVHMAKKGPLYGLSTTNVLEVDFKGAIERKRDMVRGQVQMHEELMRGNGVDVFMGEGKFVGLKTIEVEMNDGSGKRSLKGEKVVVCTGSRARIGDVTGLREAQPLTHVDALELQDIPQHLIVFGGGYVGLEFAQAMHRFGAKVTVIERHERIISNEDEDVSIALQEILLKEGIGFYLGAVVEEVSGVSGTSVCVVGRGSGNAFKIWGSHILAASGRVPNTEDIGLDRAGIKLTSSGHIQTDKHLQTTAADVFAVGDCAGSPHFTHIGVDDFRIVLSHLQGKERSTEGRQVPYTLFTDPELAHVGLSERQCKGSNIEYRLAKIPMTRVLRTATLGETEGFAKAVISSSDDQILGFTALSPDAGEMLPAVQLAMEQSLPYTVIRDLIIAHPTMNEGLSALFESVPPRS